MTKFVTFDPNRFRPDPKKPPKEKKKPKGVKKVSDKMRDLKAEYNFERKLYLAKPENKTCFVNGCARVANTVEHTKGRKGFADKWARDMDVPLMLDQRFWKPCCLKHNLEFESNPELSKQYQLSQIHEGKKI